MSRKKKQASIILLSSAREADEADELSVARAHLDRGRLAEMNGIEWRAELAINWD